MSDQCTVVPSPASTARTWGHRVTTTLFISCVIQKTHMLMWAPKKSVHASSAIQEWPSFFRSAYALKQLELNIICMPFWALNVQRCSEIQCKDIEPPGDSQRAAPCREQLPCAVHHRAIHCLNTCTYHPSYRHCSSVPCCSLGNVYGSPAAGHSPAQ